MTIYKTKNLVETYRIKAKSKEINELTGRTGRPDLTKFTINQLISKIEVHTNTILIDIGCGDGLFLQKAAEKGVDSYNGRLIGILPTKEEVSRVRDHLLNDIKTENHLISIELGLAEKTNLPDDFADIVVCNSVLHGSGQTIDNVKASLNEFFRITKIGGRLFIGEMPEADELSGKNYGDSITAWLLWVFKNQGLQQFWIRLKETMTSVFSREPFIIMPKTMFYMSPQQFIKLLDSHGFKVIEHYKLKMIDTEGNVSESQTRWNYLAYKK